MTAPLLRIGQSYDVKVAPDERTLVALTNSRIALWDMNSGEVVASREFSDPAYADSSPDGARIAVVNTSGECRVFTADGLGEVARLTEQGLGEGPGVMFGPDGDLLVQASWNGDIVVWRVPDGELVHRERERGRMIEAVAHRPDRKLFAYASAVRGESEVDVRVRRWPFAEHDPEAALRLTEGHSSIEAMALDSEGRLAIRTSDRLSVFDPAGHRLASRNAGMSGVGGSVAWSARGELAATDRRPDGAHGVSVLTAGLEEVWATELPYACAVDFSNSGELLAVGSWDAGAVFSR